jgi:Arc/MetJ family transcription regulator
MLQFIAILMYSVNVMRTTLTIDDDVAFGLKKIQRSEPSKSFKQIVNEALRRGLNGSATRPRKPFEIKPLNLGLREGLSYDNIEELLDIAEGPYRR